MKGMLECPFSRSPLIWLMTVVRDLRFEAPRPMLASEMTFIEVKIIYLTGGFLGIRKKIATLDPI